MIGSLKRNRLFAFVLSLTLVLGLLPVGAWANDDPVGTEAATTEADGGSGPGESDQAIVDAGSRPSGNAGETKPAPDADDDVVTSEEVEEAPVALAADEPAPVADYGGGAGTADDPYLISTPDQMRALADDPDNWNKAFKLTQNIDLGGEEKGTWPSIGLSEKSAFSGSFDGDNHTISGLYIFTNQNYQGLFGYVTNGFIKDLNVDGDITAAAYTGGIVGELNPLESDKGIIENCSFSGNIDGEGVGSSDTSNGGIVGYNHGGKVIKCTNHGTLNLDTQYVGGIVGENVSNNSEVQDCINEGKITIYGSKASGVGGIVGCNSTGGKVRGCENKGPVICTATDGKTGGIVGYSIGSKIEQCYNRVDINGTVLTGGLSGWSNDGSIEQSYNTGAISGTNYIGGVTGMASSSAKILQSYNAGAVTGTNYIGGVVGQNEGKATTANCYNSGSLTGTSCVGGVVGRNHNGASKASATYGKVYNCYNRGSVNGSTANTTGGVIGQNANGTSGSGTVANSYYLIGTANGGIAGADQTSGRSADVFKSGEIAWDLYHGADYDGKVWGQDLIGQDAVDEFPLLMSVGEGVGSPKVLKITFQTQNNDAYAIDYSNNGGNIALPAEDPKPSSDNYVFYDWRIGSVDGDKFTGSVTGDDDITVIAAQQEKFAGEQEPITVKGTYSYSPQALSLNLDEAMRFASGKTSTEGKFAYTIKDGNNGLQATLDPAGTSLTIPAKTPVNTDGYTLTVTAHEVGPVLSPLSLSPFGTDDVDLTVKVVIDKATPKVEASATSIIYGDTLNSSTLSGEATLDGESVRGDLTWKESSIIPTVKNDGFPAIFTPTDGSTFNSVEVTVQIEVAPKVLHIIGARAIDRTYFPGDTTVSMTGGSLESSEIVSRNGVLDAVSLVTGEATGSIDSPNASNGKAVTVSGYTLSGEDAENYTLEQPARVTVNILKAQPNVTWPMQEKTVYVNDSIKTDTFTSGSATGVDDEGLDGKFSISGQTRWTTSGAQKTEFTFEPADTENYETVTNADIDVYVSKRQVLSVEDLDAITDKDYGTDQNKLGLPTTATITTADGKTFENVPVSWEGYRSDTLEEQTLIGILDLEEYADEVENPNHVTATIKVTLKQKSADEPEYPNATETYNGSAIKHEIEGQIAGIANISYIYEGVGETSYEASVAPPTSAGTYKVTATFTMAEGYEALEQMSSMLTIVPAPIEIPESTYTYGDPTPFILNQPGVNEESVTITIQTSSNNAGTYAYDADGGLSYTAELSSPNYEISKAGIIKIDPRPVIIEWSETLIFAYNGDPHGIEAKVTNAVDGEDVGLTIEGNEETLAGDYEAKVTKLDNENYTLQGGQGITQAWHINQEAEHLTLSAEESVIYGETITIKAEIAPETSGIALLDLNPDQIEFKANGKTLAIKDVVYTDGDHDTATVEISVAATSKNGIAAGPIAIQANYSGNNDVKQQSAGTTVKVDKKPIRATLSGATTKTYDTNDSAGDMTIDLTGIEECDEGQVSASAQSYTYDFPYVDEASIITANNPLLSGDMSGNYELITDPLEVPGNIEPLEITLAWSDCDDLTYTGKPADVTAAAVGVLSDDDCTVDVSGGKETEVGDHIASAKISNPNYKLASGSESKSYKISPASLYIPAQWFTYAKTDSFTVDVDGVEGESVSATLQTTSPNVGIYTYNASETSSYAADEDNSFMAGISDNNYAITGASVVTIVPRPLTLEWPDQDVYPYTGDTYTITANLRDVMPGDGCDLIYLSNSASEVGEYNAQAVDVTDPNYTLTGVKNTNFPWRIENVTYMVRFDSKGGSKVDDAEVAHGESVAKPSDPTRKGYSFEGWYADEDLTTPYDFDTPVTGPLTLYAKWTEVSQGKDPGNNGNGKDDPNKGKGGGAGTGTAAGDGPNGDDGNGADKGDREDLATTGDTTDTVLPFAIAVVSAAVLLALTALRKRDTKGSQLH